MQSRRLADLAFMFGLFSFAYSQYRSVKKDFEHGQAWLHHAAATDNDMCVAVTQAHASRYFEEAKMTRKAAFYRVLAGNRFMKAGLKQNALECYRLALHKYINTSWDSVEDHLSAILSTDTTDRKLAVECACRLLRESDLQTDVNHAAFVDNFVETLARFKAGGEVTAL
ncbi:hypothetical protein ANCDUO_23109 [Ancylostoma duodenale]|uniref:Tetratricopeptide repeat protein n=1 Tax=Ancylostoma duodenale TaxID=51022 RepID=A0A0C2BSI9_9BILA|nr:hypothetical protein ANCDUO_23109 [Ancylostoma duodenale]